MRVSRWGDSLAVRLPKSLVQSMSLKPGDELDIVRVANDVISVEKVDARARFLAEMAKIRTPLPADYKFDREEANARRP